MTAMPDRRILATGALELPVPHSVWSAGCCWYGRIMLREPYLPNQAILELSPYGTKVIQRLVYAQQGGGFEIIVKCNQATVPWTLYAQLPLADACGTDLLTGLRLDPSSQGFTLMKTADGKWLAIKRIDGRSSVGYGGTPESAIADGIEFQKDVRL